MNAIKKIRLLARGERGAANLAWSDAMVSELAQAVCEGDC